MSYADMITLLLCFFIIYVSTSEPKQDLLAAATQGFQKQFGTVALDSPYDGVFREIQGIVTSQGQDSNIGIQKTSRGVSIEISAVNCFVGDSAEIETAQLPTLTAIAQSLQKAKLGAKYMIEVEGHTNDKQPDPNAFASNWELAATRAARVVRLMIAQGIPAEHLKATSMADTKPAVPNVDAGGNPIPENRSRNQRVVIRVESQ